MRKIYESRKEYLLDWNAKNKEKMKAYFKAYNSTEERKAINNAKQRALYAKDPSKAKERNKIWVSKNRERHKAYMRDFSAKNREAIRDYARAWRAKQTPEHKALRAAKQRAYYAKNAHKLRNKAGAKRTTKRLNFRADFFIRGKRQIEKLISRGKSISDIALFLNIPVSRVKDFCQKLNKS